MDSIIAAVLKNKNKKLTSTAIATIYTEELSSEGNSNTI